MQIYSKNSFLCSPIRFLKSPQIMLYLENVYFDQMPDWRVLHQTYSVREEQERPPIIIPYKNKRKQ